MIVVADCNPSGRLGRTPPMSENGARDADPHGRWDPVRAFHDASMSVYADLGALLNILKASTDLDLTFANLSAVATRHSAPELGDDPELRALKQAVGHLLASLATVEDVRKKSGRIGSSFWRGTGVDRTWAGVSSGSYHQVLLGVANALLEPGPGVMHGQILREAMSHRAWEQLAADLKHEFRLATVLPALRSGEGGMPPSGVPAQGGPPTRRRRVQKTIDDAGYDILCIAWDQQRPDVRKRPTWEELAKAVHNELELKGKLSSTLQALKQRAPRCREKWDQIEKEIVEERMRRRE